MRPPDPQDLLLALATDSELSRAAVCRLAETAGRWPSESAAGLGLPGKTVARALDIAAEAPARAAAARREAAAAGARLTTWLDPDYPARLRQLALAPPVLAVRGALPGDAPAVAIVGSRHPDPYGLEVAELFARALASSGVVVVSGFARGIDAAAHRGALAGGGRTIAVLGCGVDVDYPKGHGHLADAVAAHGAVVSELPAGTPPRSWNFPVRNRIIAALADALLVVQAAPRSGSLITVRHALELNRDVFAVPGRIFDERSLGPNALIRDGALLALHPRDLLEAVGHAGAPLAPAPEPDPAPAPPPVGGLPGRVLGAILPGRTCAPEDLADTTGAAVEAVLAALLELELGGWVRRLPGPVYGKI